ncbi:LEA type 2 family protein [Crocinitomicaceae bacterium]|nr:LEA type 2 family protein [Crocinitomicaceae bacterium]
MRSISTAFFLLVLLNSCGFFSFVQPELRDGEEFRIGKINGKQIEFSIEAPIYNPNAYGLKVKPSLLDVYVEDEYIGKVRLNEKIKLKRKKESEVEAFFTAELIDGFLLKALRFASKKEIKIQLKGTIKGGTFIFFKKIQLDETFKVPGASFKMNH